jgi:hypothetical protein
VATNQGTDPGASVRRTAPPTQAEAEKSSRQNPNSFDTANPGAQEASVSRSDAPAPEPRETRHAHLFVTHLDPWSVMKNSLMLSIAIGVVMVVAVTVLWAMLSASGTLDSITSTVSDVAGDGPQAIDARELFSFSRIVGTTAILALLEVVLVTALVTLFAFLYNLAVGITGGLQVTLTDDS